MYAPAVPNPPAVLRINLLTSSILALSISSELPLMQLLASYSQLYAFF